jgi:hypothetical protein
VFETVMVNDPDRLTAYLQVLARDGREVTGHGTGDGH